MKCFIVLEPTKYIEFDDGTRVRFNKVIDKLQSIKNSNYTQFDIVNYKDEVDVEEKAIFNFIAEKLVEVSCTVGYIDERSRDTKPRIYWNENHRAEVNNFIKALIVSVSSARCDESVDSNKLSNRTWMELIAKAFNVSNTVAKGMLSAMYKAKKYLSIGRDVHKKEKEEAERMDKQRAIWEEADKEDFFSMMNEMLAYNQNYKEDNKNGDDFC